MTKWMTSRPQTSQITLGFLLHLPTLLGQVSLLFLKIEVEKEYLAVLSIIFGLKMLVNICITLKVFVIDEYLLITALRRKIILLLVFDGE